MLFQEMINRLAITCVLISMMECAVEQDSQGTGFHMICSTALSASVAMTIVELIQRIM